MAKKKAPEVQTPAGAPVAAPVTNQAPAAPQAPEAPIKAPKVQLVSMNGVSRPSAGTKTARVWEIADEVSSRTGKPARRKDVLEIAQKEELNVATVATQYGRWRKFNGLKGSDEPVEETTDAQ